jgi:HAD superfamily hydrolase (TIGR01509 family)
MSNPASNKFFDAVFFDMDGLTIDSEPKWLESEIELAARFGYQWTLEDQAYCLGGPLIKLGNYMASLTNSAEPGEFFKSEIIKLMVAKTLQSATFMPGAKELLHELHQQGIPLALVSASPRVIVDAALSHVQPTPFQMTISADEVRNTKPDPEGYLKAAQLLGVDIRNCLILEDSATGVQAARASGAKVIAVPHLVKIEEDNQTKVIKSLTELNYPLLKEFFINW